MRAPFLFLVVALGLGVLAGCGGGGGGTSGTGFVSLVTFQINWPARTRSEPINAVSSAESVAVTFPGAGQGGANVVVDVDRPSTQVNAFTGSYTVPQPLNQTQTSMTLLFYAGTGEAGAVVGNATASISLAGGSLNVATVSLNTIIKFVSVIQPPAMVAQTAPVQLQFSAQDAGGANVVVSPGSATWTLVSGRSSLSLTPDGIATPLAAGSPVVQVTVDNVTSNQQTLQVGPAAIIPRQLTLSTNALLPDPATGVLYATVGSTSLVHTNEIVTIDPVAAAAATFVDPGIQPDQMAFSSDGTEMYVALNSQAQIREVDMEDGNMATPFALAPKDAWGNGNYYINSMVVDPANFNEIATTSQEFNSEGSSGPALYLNGAPLSKIAQPYSGTSMIWATANTLYAVDTSGSPASFYTYAVSSSGVTRTSDQFNSPFIGPLKLFGPSFYSSNGFVGNATTGAQTGQYVLPQQAPGSNYFPDDITMDSTNNRVFIILNSETGSGYELYVYDATSFTLLTTVPVTANENTRASGLCRFGTNGLVFRTPTNLYFLDNVPGLPASSGSGVSRKSAVVNRGKGRS